MAGLGLFLSLLIFKMGVLPTLPHRAFWSLSGKVCLHLILLPAINLIEPALPQLSPVEEHTGALGRSERGT